MTLDIWLCLLTNYRRIFKQKKPNVAESNTFFYKIQYIILSSLSAICIFSALCFITVWSDRTKRIQCEHVDRRNSTPQFLIFNMLVLVQFFISFLIFFFQLHAHLSRIQQSRQSQPSVKTLRSPLSAEFSRHCVLSGGTQRRAFALISEIGIKRKNINKQ